jgi:Ca-activated chloride channel family protein
MFRFEHPEYWPLLFLGLGVLAMAGISSWRRRRAEQALLDAHLAASVTDGNSAVRRRTQTALLTVAAVLLALTAMNPQLGSKMAKVERRGVDVALAVDISKSMLADDVYPSRLERARQTCYQLIDALRNDRIALVVFAGEAFVQLPLTWDKDAAKMIVSGIDTEILTSQGTALSTAIERSAEALSAGDEVEQEPRDRAIVIITDGEAHDEDAVPQAEEAKAKGAVVHTVGLGTEQGTPIRIGGSPEQPEFLRDGGGSVVLSKLNAELLREVAKSTGGHYVQAEGATTDLSPILRSIQGLDKTTFGAMVFTEHESYYQEVLAVALLLLLAERLIAYRSRLWTAR